MTSWEGGGGGGGGRTLENCCIMCLGEICQVRGQADQLDNSSIIAMLLQ